MELYEFDLVRYSIDRIRNNEDITESEFNNLKAFIFSRSRLYTSSKNYQDKEDYQFVVAMSCKLYMDMVKSKFAMKNVFLVG